MHSVSLFLTLRTEEHIDKWEAWAEELDGVVYAQTKNEALDKLKNNISLFLQSYSNMDDLCYFLYRKVPVFTIYNENKEILYKKNASVKNEFLVTFSNQ